MWHFGATALANQYIRKTLDFTMNEREERHCRVLSKGKVLSDLYFKRTLLNAMWGRQCQRTKMGYSRSYI